MSKDSIPYLTIDPAIEEQIRTGLWALETEMADRVDELMAGVG